MAKLPRTPRTTARDHAASLTEPEFVQRTCRPGSSQDPRSKPTRSARKKKSCRAWLLGLCSRGDSCDFPHSSAEPARERDQFRTRLCRMWLEGGVCTKRVCTHAHSFEELQRAGGGDSNEEWLAECLCARASSAPSAESSVGGELDLLDGEDLSAMPPAGTTMAASGTENPVDSTGHDSDPGNHEIIPDTGGSGSNITPPATTALPAGQMMQFTAEPRALHITFNIDGHGEVAICCW